MRTDADYEKTGQGIVNRNIRYLMFTSEMEQQELAIKLGMSKASASKKMSGSQRWSIGELLALGDIFEIPPTMLLVPHREFVKAIASSDDYLNLLMRETRCSSAQVAA